MVDNSFWTRPFLVKQRCKFPYKMNKLKINWYAQVRLKSKVKVWTTNGLGTELHWYFMYLIFFVFFFLQNYIHSGNLIVSSAACIFTYYFFFLFRFDFATSNINCSDEKRQSNAFGKHIWCSLIQEETKIQHLKFERSHYLQTWILICTVREFYLSSSHPPPP